MKRNKAKFTAIIMTVLLAVLNVNSYAESSIKMEGIDNVTQEEVVSYKFEYVHEGREKVLGAEHTCYIAKAYKNNILLYAELRREADDFVIYRCYVNGKNQNFEAPKLSRELIDKFNKKYGIVTIKAERLTKAIVSAGFKDDKEDKTISNAVYFDKYINRIMSIVGYSGGIDKLVELGIIDPLDYPAYNKQMTRREVATIVWRLLELKYDFDIGYKKYSGNFSDIYDIIPEYQEEAVSCFAVGLMGVNDKNEFRPYDFFSAEDSKLLIKRLRTIIDNKEIDLLDDIKTKVMPMPNKPEVNRISDFSNIYPYVSISLYDIPITVVSNSNQNLRKNNITANDTLFYAKEFYKQAQNYIKAYFNVSYKELDTKKVIADVYDTSDEINADYEERLKYYVSSSDSVKLKDGTITTFDKFIQQRIENIKKYKVVSQAEFITDESLYYDGNGYSQKGELRFIYYPDTDEEYLKSMGLKPGVWYSAETSISLGNTNSEWTTFKVSISCTMPNMLEFERSREDNIKFEQISK